jgi:hypothetical protein
MREQCASCKTVESTKYRIESNWHLCDDCHISWVRCEEEFNEEKKEYEKNNKIEFEVMEHGLVKIKTKE